MQALEALTRLLSIADIHLGTERARRAELEEGGPELDEMDRKELAVSICQAMLNTAILAHPEEQDAVQAASAHKQRIPAARLPARRRDDPGDQLSR